MEFGLKASCLLLLSIVVAISASQPIPSFLTIHEKISFGAQEKDAEEFKFSGTPNSKLPKGVTVLNGVNASLNDGDLRSFDKMARTASIFGIGESAHGVDGYQRMDHRLSKYLIENFGYRVVLIEACSDDRYINQYIKTGQGNLQQILYNNVWPGDTPEMAAFFNYLRDFNAANINDQVTVYVVDPQSPWLNAPVIRNFLHIYNPALEALYAPVIEQNCFGAAFNNQVDWAYSAQASAYYKTRSLPANQTGPCLNTIDLVRDLVEDNKDDIITSYGEITYGDTVDALRSLKAWEEKNMYFYTNISYALAIRERAFAKTALYKSNKFSYKKTQSILLAANLHVTKQKLLNSFFGKDYLTGSDTVGHLLANELGSGYQAVAQSGFNITAMNQKAPYPLPNVTNSIDFTLKANNLPYLLVDTQSSFVGTGDWFVHEEFAPNGRLYNLRTAFDKLIFQYQSLASPFWGKPNITSTF